MSEIRETYLTVDEYRDLFMTEFGYTAEQANRKVARALMQGSETRSWLEWHLIRLNLLIQRIGLKKAIAIIDTEDKGEVRHLVRIPSKYGK